MATSGLDKKLAIPAARRKLPASPEPYWLKQAGGYWLGYRRGKLRAVWLVRWYMGGTSYREERIGPANDGGEASAPPLVYSYEAAVERAQALYLERRLGVPAPVLSESGGSATSAGTLTVAEAVAAYLEALGQDRKSARGARLFFERDVLPRFGERLVASLRRPELLSWRSTMLDTPPRVRQPRKPGAPPKGGKRRNAPRVRPRARSESADPFAYLKLTKAEQDRRRAAEAERLAAFHTEEGRRRRRGTVNRLWASFRAALNFAAETYPEIDPRHWDIKPFDHVTEYAPNPIPADALRRLLKACEPPEFRDLVHAGYLTGARVSELGGMKAEQFLEREQRVHFPVTKGGKPRDLRLTAPALALFKRLTKGKKAGAFIFLRPSADGPRPWGKNEHVRAWDAALRKAKLEPEPGVARFTFHCLRDTFATELLAAGASMDEVSRLLGHSSVNVTAKHYGRFAQKRIDAAALLLPAIE